MDFLHRQKSIANVSTTNEAHQKTNGLEAKPMKKKNTFLKKLAVLALAAVMLLAMQLYVLDVDFGIGPVARGAESEEGADIGDVGDGLAYPESTDVAITGMGEPVPYTDDFNVFGNNEKLIDAVIDEQENNVYQFEGLENHDEYGFGEIDYQEDDELEIEMQQMEIMPLSNVEAGGAFGENN